MALKRKRFNISFAPAQFIEELMQFKKDDIQFLGGYGYSCVCRGEWFFLLLFAPISVKLLIMEI